MYINKKILIILLLIGSIFLGIAYAANTITSLTETVEEGDIMSATYFNNLNGEKTDGGFCKYSGEQLVCVDTDTIPDGYTKKNGIIYTTDEQTATTHLNAMLNCAIKESHICEIHEYRRAGLGTDFGTYDDFIAGGDNNLWWNGNAIYNYTIGCYGTSCTVGSTMSAGYYETNKYVTMDITDCDERCNRQLKYYCCYSR